MGTIIQDLRQNSQYAARQWKLYQAAVRRIGDTESLREANEGLGYNLVKTIPGLLAWIEELQGEVDGLRRNLSESRVNIGTVTQEEIDKAKARPLGIPAEHIILNVSESLELEVVTEEAPSSDGFKFNQNTHGAPPTEDLTLSPAEEPFKDDKDVGPITGPLAKSLDLEVVTEIDISGHYFDSCNPRCEDCQEVFKAVL